MDIGPDILLTTPEGFLVWTGGLGIRSVSKLASVAFIASAAGTRILKLLAFDPARPIVYTRCLLSSE